MRLSNKHDLLCSRCTNHGPGSRCFSFGEIVLFLVCHLHELAGIYACVPIGLLLQIK